MKMLGLAFVAGDKRVSPPDEKHSASMTLSAKSGQSATAKEAKRPC
jgi:hypothetical protein